MGPDVSDQFIQFFQLHATPTPGAGTVTAWPSAEQARALEARAEQEAGKSPAPFLDEEQAAELGRKRTPQLGEILHQIGVGLGAAPAISAEVPVSAELCERIIAADDATTQLIKASGDVHVAASAGVALCAAEAGDLGRRVLAAIAEKARGDYPLVLRFASAFSLFQAAAQKQKEALGKAEAAVAPARAETGAAVERTEEARALSAFHRKNRR